MKLIASQGNIRYLSHKLLPLISFGCLIKDGKSITQIIRVDITSDIGYAISPEVDIGQIEGAYTMGLGYFLQEKVVYDEETGELLTNRTWVRPRVNRDINVPDIIQV